MASKSRFFTGIVFEDSAPKDWRQQLRDSLQMWLVSPLHSADEGATKPNDLVMASGEHGASFAAIDMNSVFKNHWHVMYCHSNTVTPKAVRDLMPPWMFIHPDPYKFMVSAQQNLARYFCHLDQPEKQQFDGEPTEIMEVINGFPLDLERKLTKKEERDLQLTILDTMDEMNLTEFIDIVGYFRQIQDWQAFDYINRHHGWVDKLCSSARGKAKFEAQQAAKAAYEAQNREMLKESPDEWEQLEGGAIKRPKVPEAGE